MLGTPLESSSRGHPSPPLTGNSEASALGALFVAFVSPRANDFNLHVRKQRRQRPQSSKHRGHQRHHATHRHPSRKRHLQEHLVVLVADDETADVASAMSSLILPTSSLAAKSICSVKVCSSSALSLLILSGSLLTDPPWSWVPSNTNTVTYVVACVHCSPRKSPTAGKGLVPECGYHSPACSRPPAYRQAARRAHASTPARGGPVKTLMDRSRSWAFSTRCSEPHTVASCSFGG